MVLWLFCYLKNRKELQYVQLKDDPLQLENDPLTTTLSVHKFDQFLSI